MIGGIIQCRAGLDVDKKIEVCSVLKEQGDGSLHKQTREYSTFRHQLEKLAEWLEEQEESLAVRESRRV